MNAKQALNNLGVNEDTLSPEQKQGLDQDGFILIEEGLAPEAYAKMCHRFDKIQEVEGEKGGWEVHTEAGAPRLSNGLNKATEFDDCLEIRPLLASAYYILATEFKVHGFNIRDASPGRGQQRIHTDYGRAVEAGDYHIVNSLILLDPFTPDNGAARIVPGSHLSGQRPEDVMDDPLDPHPDEILITAPAGSVVILNAHTWHGGTLNVSGERRRVIHLSYCLRDDPQQLVQQDFLTEGLYQRMSPAHRCLLDIHL